MFVRCAYFVGRPLPGKEEELHRSLQRAAKLYLGFPKIRSAQYLRAASADEGAPRIHATLQIVFDSEEDLAAALATPHRQETRAFLAQAVKPLFDGTVQHINHHFEQHAA